VVKTVTGIFAAGDLAPERLRTIGYGDTRPAIYEPIPEDINSAEAHANIESSF